MKKDNPAWKTSKSDNYQSYNIQIFLLCLKENLAKKASFKPSKNNLGHDKKYENDWKWYMLIYFAKL